MRIENNETSYRPRLSYAGVLAGAKFSIGQHIRVKYEFTKSEGRWNWKDGTVAGIYRHHILIDFGAYKECRRKADLYLGLC